MSWMIYSVLLSKLNAMHKLIHHSMRELNLIEL